MTEKEAGLLRATRVEEDDVGEGVERFLQAHIRLARAKAELRSAERQVQAMGEWLASGNGRKTREHLVLNGLLDPAFLPCNREQFDEVAGVPLGWGQVERECRRVADAVSAYIDEKRAQTQTRQPTT
jgi:hypothetical protein